MLETGTGGTVTARKMTSGANTLSYGLYQDIARATNWGNTPGTDTVNTTGKWYCSGLHCIRPDTCKSDSAYWNLY